jgi:hypothetical protein
VKGTNAEPFYAKTSENWPHCHVPLIIGKWRKINVVPVTMTLLLKANDTGNDVNVIMIADDSVYLVLWYKDGNPQPVYSYDARYKKIVQKNL